MRQRAKTTRRNHSGALFVRQSGFPKGVPFGGSSRAGLRIIPVLEGGALEALYFYTISSQMLLEKATGSSMGRPSMSSA
jgi:hypothetical protein